MMNIFEVWQLYTISCRELSEQMFSVCKYLFNGGFLGILEAFVCLGVPLVVMLIFTPYAQNKQIKR